MKDFKEFLALLDEDTVSGIFNDAKIETARMLKRIKSVTPEENISGTQVGAMSFTIALELLAVYHEWISQ